MKFLYKLSIPTILVSLLFFTDSLAQSVGISNSGAYTPNTKSILDMDDVSGTKGLLLPRMTTAERGVVGVPHPANSTGFTATLGAPEAGMTVYNSSTNMYNYWDGAAWQELGTSGDVDAVAADLAAHEAADNDLSSTNELQNLSSSASGTNRTINITGGTGTTISVADNDNNSSNEIQSLGISGSTITLSNGGGSVTVPSSADNLGNHSATQSLDMNDFNLLDANTVQANTLMDPEDGTLTVNDNLYISGNTTTNGDFIGRIQVEDTRTTNPGPVTYDREVHFEFKNRGIVGSPGSGTYGGMMTMSPWSDNSGNRSHQVFYNDGGIYYRNGLPNSGTWGSWDRIMTQSALPDNSATNELQNLSSSASGTNRTINITSGTGTTINVADNDNNSSNEIQSLGISGSTISLSNGGGSVTVPSSADNLGNHTATTTLNMSNLNITNVNNLSTRGLSSYDKLRVWNSSNYTIGMHTAMSLGYLNDFAMTFTMNNDPDRGWVWRDVNDAQNDGAMSLTTGGRLYVKGSSSFNSDLGIGTTSPNSDLHVFRADNDIARVYATGGTQGSGMFFAGQSVAYGGGFVYDGDGTPALVGGTDRITFFRRNNGADIDVMSYGYNSSVVRVSSLSGAGNRMVVANANGDLTTQAIPSNGDITSVTAGDGLTDGGTTGAVTLNVVATNGLTDNANDIRLGGNLVQATTITSGNGQPLTINLAGDGDFRVQDNGSTHFEVRDNGISFFGDDTYWRDGNTGGTNLMILSDDGNDGRLRIYENGATSVDLDANSEFIFNEQGLDRDFRVESDLVTNMFVVNAGTNRVGIGTNAPAGRLEVENSGTEYLLYGTTGNLSVYDAETTTGEVRLGSAWNRPGVYSSTSLQLFSDVTGIIFGDSNVERMRMEATGDFGIGTNNPTQRLDVNGNVRIRGGAPAVGDVLTATNTNGTADWQPANNGVTMVPFHNDNSGTNFWTHPDINVTVSFNGTTEVVTVTNNSGGYWDISIHGFCGTGSGTPTMISNDVANGNTLTLDLGTGSDGGFTVTGGDESGGQVQGFTMNMSYWADNMSGLISYW